MSSRSEQTAVGVPLSPGPCCFCDEVHARRTNEYSELYGRAKDRSLWACDRLILIPSLGQVGKGHMLLVPESHVTAFAALTPTLRANSLRAYSYVRPWMEKHFGPVVAFEHGSPPQAVTGGCGILHAHMHFVPVRRSVDSPPDIGLEWQPAPGKNWAAWIEQRWTRDKEYVFFSGSDGSCHVAWTHALPSQTMRKWAASVNGHPCWDWRTAGYEADLERLIEWLRHNRPPGFHARFVDIGGTYG